MYIYAPPFDMTKLCKSSISQLIFYESHSNFGSNDLISSLTKFYMVIYPLNHPYLNYHQSLDLGFFLFFIDQHSESYNNVGLTITQ